MKQFFEPQGRLQKPHRWDAECRVQSSKRKVQSVFCSALLTLRRPPILHFCQIPPSCRRFPHLYLYLCPFILVFRKMLPILPNLPDVLPLATQKLIPRDVNLLQRDVNLLQRDVNLLQRDVNLLQRDVNLLQRDVNLLQRDVNLLQRDVNLLQRDVNLLQRDV
ncbi:MAG: hypothetical protein FWH27_11695, partial [Planctomycetaceae bacterium]|nr:hypothetical protein [Planctomycetaceae bacterium]